MNALMLVVTWVMGFLMLLVIRVWVIQGMRTCALNECLLRVHAAGFDASNRHLVYEQLVARGDFEQMFWRVWRWRYRDLYPDGWLDGPK